MLQHCSFLPKVIIAVIRMRTLLSIACFISICIILNSFLVNEFIVDLQYVEVFSFCLTLLAIYYPLWNLYHETLLKKDIALTYLHNFLDYSNDGIITYDNTGRICSFNKKAEKILGYSSTEVLGKELAHFFLSDAMHEEVSFWDKIRPHQEKRVEVELLHKNGNACSVTLMTTEVSTPGERAFICFIQDKSAEADLFRITEKHQELLRLANRSMQDGIWDWDIQSDSLWLSPRWKEMLGYKDCELKNSFDTLKSLIVPEDYMQVCKLTDSHLRSQLPFHGVFRFYHKDGSLRHILSRAYTAKGAYGEPIRMVGTHTDMTERVTLQEKLAESTKKLELLHNCLPVISCQLQFSDTQTFSIPYISDQVTEICGVTPEQLYEDSTLLLQLIHPDDKETVLSTLKHSLTHKNDWSFQCRIQHNGTIRWLHAKFISPASMDEKTLWNGTIMDISEFRTFSG